MKNKKIDNILILYVEDDENIREIYERYLRRIIQNIVIAKNGQEGYEKFKEYQPDLIVTDIKMPIMNGLEMSKKIREESIDVPIVLTTAHTETEFFQDAIKIGVNSFLLKPVDMKKLQKIIIEISENIILKLKSTEAEKIINERDKMVALTDLLSNIAHQWRQPLAAISAASVNLQFQIEAGNQDTKLLNKRIEVIGDSVQYLSKTIDSFRHFINEDKMPKEFDVIDCIKQCLNIESGMISSKKIKIISNVDKEIIYRGFKDEFVQALINIINNCLDVFEQNQIGNPLIQIETKVDENKISMLIKDNGGGISNNVIDNMFEPYTTTKHKSAGVGLGLHMAYKIITEYMNGIIKAENCTFEINKEKYTGACISVVLSKNDT